MTTLPLLLISLDTIALTATNATALAAAFIVSVLGGWLMLLAPAGIGVREALFAASSSWIVDWDTALSWVLVHRVMAKGVDILAGLTALTAIVRTKHDAYDVK
ncbi:MAG: hypothetical protein GKR94_19195 [Gammaproteobacteria bacterium]|nr:hypothetical protein [Gammaproteobacteria bacterium]